MRRRSLYMFWIGIICAAVWLFILMVLNLLCMSNSNCMEARQKTNQDEYLEVESLGSRKELYSGMDDINYLYNVDLDKERKMNIKGGPMDYLEDYKNPCWMSELPSVHPYEDNGYQDKLETFRGLGEFSVAASFSRMTSLFKARLKKGDSWRLRCLPLVYLVGVTKSGTTDFFQKLIGHPDIEAGAIKEPMWWNKHSLVNVTQPGAHPYPLSDYIDLFDQAAEKIRIHYDNQSGHMYHHQITIDGSPNYLWDYDGWSLIPENMGLDEPKFTVAHSLSKLVPQAKIIVLLRNPVDRLYSQYRLLSPFASPETFHELVVKAVNILQECLNKRSTRSCAYDYNIYKDDTSFSGRGLLLRASMYDVFLRDWLSVFPHDQVFVIRAEDYYADRETTIQQVFRFLGVNPLVQEKMSLATVKRAINTKDHYDVRSKLPMLNETRQILSAFYKPFNERLARLLNHDRFLWQDSDSQ